MSKITNIIFNGATHKVSSKYGPRDTISTAAGSSGKFHRGTDYSTSFKKTSAICNKAVIYCLVELQMTGQFLFGLNTPD